MRIAMIGLGRMGGNMARRLMKAGVDVVAFDRRHDLVAELVSEGAIAASSMDNLREKLGEPAIFWVMLPAGAVTEGVVQDLLVGARPGDIIVDGGNTHYKDDGRRAASARQKGVHYVDVGTSGGVWGLERGYCLMIGGEPEIVDYLTPLWEALAPGPTGVATTVGRTGDAPAERGYIHAGSAGAGHFVKMVHNGIEYGLMQAYAEGFEILKARARETLPEGERLDLNLAEIAEVWRRGSVISSWLLDLIAGALHDDAELTMFSGRVSDSGEGQWTLDAAMESSVPANVLAAALFARYRSRSEDPFGDKLLSAMRFGFGGHTEMPQ